jgi:hypothetical protein
MDILIFVALFMVGIFGNLIASDLYDRCPSIARWIVSYAVLRLPESDRARYHEEWCAHIDECSSNLGMVWHALGCPFAAGKLAIEHPPAKTAGLTLEQAKRQIRAALCGVTIIIGSFLVFYSMDPDLLKLSIVGTMYRALVTLGSILSVVVLTIAGLRYMLAFSK